MLPSLFLPKFLPAHPPLCLPGIFIICFLKSVTLRSYPNTPPLICFTSIFFFITVSFYSNRKTSRSSKRTSLLNSNPLQSRSKRRRKWRASCRKSSRYAGWGCIPVIQGVRASLRFEQRLNFSINPRKLSIFYRSCSNGGDALAVM